MPAFHHPFFWSKPILMLLHAGKALPDDRIEVMGISGACPELSRVEIRQVAAFLRNNVVPRLEADDRIIIDGTITKTPDDRNFYREQHEIHKNYSANKDVIVKVCEFFETAQGLIIY
jgi:hypothetical protein